MSELLEGSVYFRTLEDISKDFECSEITVAFLHDNTTNSFTNVFSVSEMCPIEQLKSNEIFDFNSAGNKVHFKRLSLGKGRTIYVTRYFSNKPVDCIEFYRGRANTRILSMDNDELIISSFCNQLKEEPLNEVPVLIPSYKHKNTSLGAILPKRNVSMRVCSRIDLEGSTIGSFTNDELVEISRFIEEVLGINIIKYSEYFGAVLLCFSNPIIRSVEERLAKLENQILIQLFERKERTITDGVIEISDERINGKGFVIRKTIEKPHFLVDIPCPPDKLRVRIFNKENELIEDSESYFLKSINLQIGIMGAKRKVTITDKEQNTNTYEIDTVIYESANQKREMSVKKLLIENEEFRELDTLEEKRIFIYFPGNESNSKKYAQEIIRELLGKAKERCTICDPYLSGNDVIEYALFVKNTSVQVELLSSSGFLIKKIKDTDKIYGEELKNVIDSIKRKDSTMKIKCHVLAGREKSPLHDRFIIIDDDVYLLGSSLNEFGTRATTLFKSPDPRPLVRQADIWIQDDKYSMPIELWIENHNMKV
jgi:hypothetical protein